MIKIKILIAGALISVINTSAFAVTYTVPTDGTLAAVTTSANSYAGTDAVDIDIVGDQTNTSSTTNIIKHAVDITGTDSTAIITGSIAFTNGTNKNSTVSDLTFTGASNTALVNGTGSGNIAGHTMTLSDVIFDSNINTGGMQGNAGAILNYASMTINNGTFTNNSAVGGGAAIISTKSNAYFNITNSSFANNTTTSGSGGAIALDNNAYNAENTITSTSFTSNIANTNGGAISSTSSELTLGSASVKSNTATTGMGGGLYWYGASTNTLNIKNGSVFDGNTSGKDGGAVNKYANGNSYIDDTIFSNNKSTSGNGGALSTIGVMDSITNTQFINNQASRLGGGWYSNSTNVSIDNVLFDGNTAGTDGGGLQDYGGLTTISINNATFKNNTATAGNGGGASIGGDMTISNTSFISNHADAKYAGGLYSTGMDSHLDSVLFDGNSATNGGGLMHMAYTTSGGITGGVMTIGGNSTFKNNTATQGGGAIFNFTTVNLDTTSGNIIFENNSADEGADIYNNSSDPLYGVVNIIGDTNTLSMDGGIYGDVKTSVNKTGANNLVFLERADNTGFTGTYTQSAGATTVYADNFFNGINNISNNSSVHFVNSAAFNNLNMETGATLSLGENDFITLSVADFASDGSAKINMHTDGIGADVLKLTDSATGASTINFTVTGNTPTNNHILVVDLTGATSDATFAMTDDTLDIGAFAYKLVQDADNNWYLQTDGDSDGDGHVDSIDGLSKTARAVMGIPALHLSVVNSGMNELRKRLGTLRNNNDNNELTGVWGRGYAKVIKIHENFESDMGMTGFEGGIDVMANALNGKVYFGIMGGMQYSDDIDIDTSRHEPASGKLKAPSAGAYLTWIHKSGGSSKYFVDLTARHFWVHTNIEKDDNTNGYDVERSFWAFSAETGKLFYMESPEWMNMGILQHSHVSIEPKFELRYGSGAAEDFTTDAGNRGYVDTTTAFSTRLNLQVNYLPNGVYSKWKPYLELGVYREWAGDTDIEFAGVDIEASDTTGMGAELTLGTSAIISDKTYAYGAITAEVGQVYTSLQLNLGVRTKF